MKHQIYSLLLLLLAFCTPVSAQNIDFIPRNFPGREPELNRIIALMQKADSLFYKPSQGNAADALKIYLEAGQFNPLNTFLQYKTGACYLWSTQKQKAKDFLLSSYHDDPGINTDICYLLGQAYHYHSQWDSALYYYQLFSDRYLTDHLAPMSKTEAGFLKEDLKRWIDWANNGKELMSRPLSVIITNLGDSVNSPDPDYNPRLTANAGEIAFTSRRASTTGGLRHVLDDKFYEDIYFSRYQNRQWQWPVNPGNPLNTALNDGLVSLALDGQSVILDYGGISGDLYESFLNGNRWSKPKAFPAQINSPEIESSACWSPDGKILYFSSDRPGGMGGADIWTATLNPDGSFQPPVNPGPPLNSPFNEEYIFMHADGKSLYFSFDGPAAMGEYDVFYSKYDAIQNQWSAPVNIGYPVNTADDDIYFSVSPDGKTAWYSSERPEGFGGQDIYRIDFVENEVKPFPLRLVNGKVMDAIGFMPLAADIEVNDPLNNTRILNLHTNSADGSFSLSLPAGKRYGLVFTAEGYLFHTENLDLTNLQEYNNGKKHIFLYRIDKSARPERAVGEAVRQLCFQIECDSAAALWVDPANGSVEKESVMAVQQDIGKILVRNREKVTRFIEGGILMDDVVDLLCHEYVKQIASSEQYIESGRHTDIWKLVKAELVTYRKLQEINPQDSLYFQVPYRVVNRKVEMFTINLSSIAADAINDTTARLEIPVNLTQSVLNNFVRIVLDNRQQIRNLKSKQWEPRRIREQLAWEIAVCGGYRQSKDLCRQSQILQSLLAEAMVSVMPDVFLQSVFFSKKPLQPAENGQIDVMLGNRRTIIRDLIGAGKSIQEVGDLLIAEIQNQSEALPAVDLKTGLRDALHKTFLEIVAMDYLNPQETRSLQTDTLAVSVVKGLLNNGLSYNDLKKCMSILSDSLTSGGEQKTERAAIVLPDVSLLIPDRRMFKLSLFETSREAISDIDGSVEENKQAVFKMDLKRIVEEKQDLLTGLKNAGFTEQELTDLLCREIALNGGALDENGDAMCHPSVISLIGQTLEQGLADPDRRTVFVNPLSQEELQSLCRYRGEQGQKQNNLLFVNKWLKPNQELLSLLVKLHKSEARVKEMVLDGILQNCQMEGSDSQYVKELVSLSFEGFLNDVLLTPPKYQSKVVLNNIFFETNMAELALSSHVELQRLIAILEKYPGIRVEISGHTDNIGSDQYNMELSLRRAKSVESFLLKHGIPANRMIARGYGKTKPVAPNNLEDGTDYPEGRQMNRRTEFLILD